MVDDLKRRAETLAKRPYSIVVILDETTDENPVYFAKTLELPGCFGQGRNPTEAESSLREAIVDYIYSLLVDNLPVPPPNLSNTSTTGLVSASKLVLRYSQSDLNNPKDTKVDNQLVVAYNGVA